jgi:hypothetical protein
LGVHSGLCERMARTILAPRYERRIHLNHMTFPAASKLQPLAPKIVTGIGLLWGVFAIIAYYRFYPIDIVIKWHLVVPPPWLKDLHERPFVFPMDVFIQGGLLLWIAVVIGILGDSLMRYWYRDGLNRSERWIWGSGIVLGLLGTIVFWLGVFHTYHYARILFAAMFIIASIVAAILLIRRHRKPYRIESKTTESEVAPHSRWRILKWILFVVLFCVQACAFLYALTPCVESDALRYHLTAPQEWLKLGGLSYIPFNAFACFPSTIEMLFLFGMGLAGDLLAKGFHFLYLPLTTGVVALLVRETVRQMHGEDAERSKMSEVLAAFAWGTMPLTVFLAGWAFIDLALTFYSLGIVYFLMRWMRTRRREDWLASAVMGGILMASKYTGVMSVGFASVVFSLVGFFWPSESDRTISLIRRFGLCIWRSTIYGLIGCAIASPWWIKNLIQTGNPVYPLAWSIFGGGDWSLSNGELWTQKMQSTGLGHSLFALSTLPWTTMAYPEKFGGFIVGPLFWMLTLPILLWAIYAICKIRRRPAGAFLVAWGAFFLFSHFFLTYQSSRFLLPGWAVALVIVAAAFAAVSPHLGRILRGSAIAVFLVASGFGVLLSTIWLLSDGGQCDFTKWKCNLRWPSFVLGRLSRDEYLAQNLNYYPAVYYANRMIKPGEKVLMVGEHRKFHWQCAVEGSDWYDTPSYLAELRSSPNADAFIDALQKRGITHVFFNLSEWGWPGDPKKLPPDWKPVPGSNWYFNRRFFTPEDLAKLQAFISSPRLESLVAPEKGKIYLAKLKAKGK